MQLPEKIHFMQDDTEDEAAIELGDGRVLMLHPYSDDDGAEAAEFRNAFLKAVTHRYNSFNTLLSELVVTRDELDKLAYRGRDIWVALAAQRLRKAITDLTKDTNNAP